MNTRYASALPLLFAGLMGYGFVNAQVAVVDPPEALQGLMPPQSSSVAACDLSCRPSPTETVGNLVLGPGGVRVKGQANDISSVEAGKPVIYALEDSLAMRDERISMQA